MKKKESIADFFDLHGQAYNAGIFNIERLEEFGCNTSYQPVNRRDFYKVSLMTKGGGLLSYAEKTIRIATPCLTFSNPMIPYSWEPIETEQAGYFCLFKEDFIDGHLKYGGLDQSPLFRIGGSHVFFPEADKVTFLSQLFETMLQEKVSGYRNKYDLLKSYLQIVMHEALKMQPSGSYETHINAPARISTLFFDLLERQFPLEPPHQVIGLKNANEFASQLNIHTNHLNRSLKETTGKATSAWIAERIVREARDLLLHSDADISSIGFSLGFEHPSNFIIFFKKQTGQTPSQFRKEPVSIS
ncbi:MAG TPA: helix-turn-helix domain-containing protein [Chitinophaga sp.]|uniref:helix-turn-helix domain-containing protein n=1 Tax=Chitinophaga sp. TaxID=1869181 RepID=UPI002C58A73E|nr:helix-turn-helix domain-containing protein [Chitinophaga sp.]HVI48077.1 helix-turn-helix domain-containing protein [Chitinophaga sp.]